MTATNSYVLRRASPPTELEPTVIISKARKQWWNSYQHEMSNIWHCRIRGIQFKPHVTVVVFHNE